MNDSLIVTLHYKRSHFAELYYPNGENNFLKNKTSIYYFIWMLACILVYFFSTQLIDNGYLQFVVGLVMSALLMPVLLTLLVVHLVKTYRYRNSIEPLIKTLTDTSETVSCNATGITLANVKETVITRWESVKQLKIANNYLSLYVAKDYHVLPRSSMTETEFETLSTYLSGKISMQDATLTE